MDRTKYIAGYVEVKKEWLKPFLELWREGLIDDIINLTIPIYTVKNRHPVTGREDCNLTRAFKEQRRLSMRNRLTEAGDDQEKIKAIIERYAKTEQ